MLESMISFSSVVIASVVKDSSTSSLGVTLMGFPPLSRVEAFDANLLRGGLGTKPSPNCIGILWSMVYVGMLGQLVGESESRSSQSSVGASGSGTDLLGASTNSGSIGRLGRFSGRGISRKPFSH